LTTLQFDGRQDTVGFVGSFPVDFLPADRGDIELRAAKARTDLIDAGLFHRDEAPQHMGPLAGKGVVPSELLDRHGQGRLELLIVGGRIVVARIDGDHRVADQAAPLGALSIDLADTDHVGLAGEDVNLNRFVPGV